MRVTKRTNIAMRLLMFCAANEGRLVTKADVAKRCNASENHLAQVIHQLALLDYLRTQRGRNGGFSLARPAHQISVGDVFRDIEGPVPLAECFADADQSCPLASACLLRPAMAAAASAFYEALDPIVLSDLVDGNAPLQAILCDPSPSKPCRTGQAAREGS